VCLHLMVQFALGKATWDLDDGALFRKVLFQFSVFGFFMDFTNAFNRRKQCHNYFISLGLYKMILNIFFICSRRSWTGLLGVSKRCGTTSSLATLVHSLLHHDSHAGTW
jgi:hypothetical protein